MGGCGGHAAILRSQKTIGQLLSLLTIVMAAKEDADRILCILTNRYIIQSVIYSLLHLRRFKEIC